MARLIQEQLKKPLAEMILFGALADKGGRVHVSVKGDALQLDAEAVERREPAKMH
jgi:ATP-dependent Clp protease ATP-binding subunit ClpA